MNAATLLGYLRSRGVELWAEGARLRFNAPKGVITEELRTQLSACKAELLPLLRQVKPVSGAAIPLVDRSRNLPLSFNQQRLWFLEQLSPGGAVYNQAAAVRLSGSLAIAALKQSFNRVVERHEALRTCFPVVDGQPVQKIQPASPLPLPVVVLPEGLEEDDSAVRQKMLIEAQQPFDLVHGPLLRALLLRLGETEHLLLVTMHHIISDGWSVGLFIQELGTLYAAIHTGRALSLPALPIQYADFAAWQQERMQGDALTAQLTYWKQQLAGAKPLLELPTDHPRPAAQTFRGATHLFKLPVELSARLKTLAQQSGATLFMVLLAAFQAFLHRYTGQTDISVGCPISSRNRSEIEALIGFFANTLVMRSDLSGNPTFSALLARVRAVALGAYAHQDLPLERLMEELQPERALSHQPLFQVAFVLQNAPAETQRLPDLTLKPLEINSGTAKFDLTLSMMDTAHGLVGLLEYSTDLFEAETVRRLVGHFEHLIAGIAADPHRPLAYLPLLAPEERHQLLVEFNSTRTDYPKDATISQRFEQQVLATPTATALVFAGETLTYRQLNERANQLAQYLQKLGVGPEITVAVHLERSFELIVALLAILKAGGVYLPLDPHYPAERLEFMFADARPALLLTSAQLETLSDTRKTVVVHLDQDSEAIAHQNTANPLSSIAADNLAYLVYTSGSTGTPKAVAIPHKAVLRLVLDNHFAPLNRHQTFLQLAPVSFDAATFEIWAPLLNGAKLVLAPAAFPSLEALGQLLRSEQVTTLWLTAGLFHQMVECELESLQGVRHLLAGGDVLSVAAVRRCRAALPDCTLINGYGPTENTTFTCCHTLSAEFVTESVPIGVPIANTRVYVLDTRMQLVPVGVAGELYVGGEGLARGYLGQAGWTAERFIPDPFSEGGGERLYRTGDRVRWQAGVLEFLGRFDDQVKVRGFRVEPAEVEAALQQHLGIRQAAVTVREDAAGGMHLIAYVVAAWQAGPRKGRSAARTALSPAKLRAFLQAKLPEYMIPSAFVVLDCLPLTANGKLDRACLPAPEALLPDGERVAPRDTIELQLVQIWEDLLGRSPIGVTDNFFDLGGHSLLAVRLMAHLADRFALHLPLTTLFGGASVEQLAAVLRSQAGPPPFSSLVPIQPDGSRPPFFCVHPAGGNVLCYVALARRLGPDQPFYGLQAQGVDGRAAPHLTVEAMAAHYLEALRTVQPRGPYYLGGHSSGGLVAFEMARQLQAQGESAALLALLDTPAFLDERFVPPAEDDAQWLANLAAVIGHFYERPVPIAYADLAPLTPSEQLHSLLTRLEEAGLVPPQTDSLLVRGLLAVYKANTRAAQAYRPAPYPHKVTLLRSEAFEPGEDETFGWRAVACAVEVISVPGDHISMIKEPHVQSLAGILAHHLGSTDA